MQDSRCKIEFQDPIPRAESRSAKYFTGGAWETNLQKIYADRLEQKTTAKKPTPLRCPRLGSSGIYLCRAVEIDFKERKRENSKMIELRKKKSFKNKIKKCRILIYNMSGLINY